jgi:hypothetical protein
MTKEKTTKNDWKMEQRVIFHRKKTREQEVKENNLTRGSLPLLLLLGSLKNFREKNGKNSG